MPIEIFCCYTHKDQILLQGIITSLLPLQLQGLITLWADTDISAGTEWEQEVNKHLNTAAIILLLISPDFMASNYAYSKEMQRAMERHERGESKVIPIILRPVYWQGAPFGKLQALPRDGKPVTSSEWHSLDEAFFHVAEGIRKEVVNRIEQTQAQPVAANEPVPLSQMPQLSATHQRRSSWKSAFLLALVLLCICFLVLGTLFLYPGYQQKWFPKHIVPGGAWISPANGETLHGTIHFAAYAYPTHPNEPTISRVNFTAFWQGVDPRTWKVLCVISVPSQKDVFSCDANPGRIGAPAGKMQISFDVYDQQGNTNYAPNGKHTITYTPI